MLIWVGKPASVLKTDVRSSMSWRRARGFLVDEDSNVNLNTILPSHAMGFHKRSSSSDDGSDQSNHGSHQVYQKLNPIRATRQRGVHFPILHAMEAR